MNYTWLLRGIPGSTKNIKFVGSLNIISAISTTGVSYSAIVTDTTTKDIFIQYIQKLMELVNKVEKYRTQKLC